MKITLTPALRKYIEREMKAGRYESPDEIIAEAVRAMMNREEELEKIGVAIDESREQLRRGEGIPGSEITVDRIREGAIKRFGLPRRKKAS
jgi:putative addiction module CopG family antidote